MIISGKIQDTTGEPLMGANIYVIKNGKFSDQGGASDYNGNFSIDLKDVDDETEINISYIGYKTIKTKAGDLDEKTVTMLEDAEQLDEVVLTFNKPKKATNTKDNTKLIKILVVSGLLISIAGLGFLIYKKSK